MTSRELAYWLQGYFELLNPARSAKLRPEQVELIRAHCALVRARYPDDLFAAAVSALVDAPEALRTIIEAQFTPVTRVQEAMPAPTGPADTESIVDALHRCQLAACASADRGARYC